MFRHSQYFYDCNISANTKLGLRVTARAEKVIMCEGSETGQMGPLWRSPTPWLCLSTNERRDCRVIVGVIKIEMIFCWKHKKVLFFYVARIRQNNILPSRTQHQLLLLLFIIKSKLFLKLQNHCRSITTLSFFCPYNCCILSRDLIVLRCPRPT